MLIRIRKNYGGSAGFFLMEALILIVVFISFSAVLAGWYSHFLKKKSDIARRVRALLIASNVLEKVRMQRRVPDFSDDFVEEGFKVSVSLERSIYEDYSGPARFVEVTVSVKFNDELHPVCLTTGLMLQESNSILKEKHEGEKSI